MPQNEQAAKLAQFCQGLQSPSLKLRLLQDAMKKVDEEFQPPSQDDMNKLREKSSSK